jgi:hypothetical protein
MKKFKASITRAVAFGVKDLIDDLINSKPTTDDDRLLIACLAEIAAMLENKIGGYKPIKEAYPLTLTPAQAIAIRILSTDYQPDKTSYIGNHLHILANQIHKQYN